MSKNHKKSHKKRRKVKIKKKRKMRKKDKNKRLAFHFFIAVFITTTIYVGLFFTLFSLGKMDGYSMLPTLNNEDIVAINRHKKVKRFDIAYIVTPDSKESKSIRRIIGLPGDELVFKEDELFINGENKEETYLTQKKRSMGNMMLTDDFSLKDLTGEVKVPKDCYFVLGDNRKSSTDSRYYGFVPKKDVIGKVELRLFPISKFKVY